jgi:hypothetical protein
MCHGFVLVLLVDLVLCYVLTQRGAIMKQGKDSGMWLIGYIRLDSLTKTYMGKKVPLSRFWITPFKTHVESSTMSYKIESLPSL